MHPTAEISVMVSAAREVIGAEVLVIDKDASVRAGMAELFGEGDLHVTCVEDPSMAWELFEQRFFSVVVIDLDSPAPSDGLETVATVKLASPTSAVLLLTPRRSFDDAVAGLRAGALDVVLKSPDSVGYLRQRIIEAASSSLAHRQRDLTLREVRGLQDEFLRRYMDAERRAYELDDRLAGRSNKSPIGGELAVVVVDPRGELAGALTAAAPRGVRVVAALSGGEALDRASSGEFQIALVADELHDLPASMVVRSLKTASPETLVLGFSGPGPGGKVDAIEGERRIPVLAEFPDVAALVAKLDELGEASHARERERRYLQSFREKNYDFLRRLANLKAKLDKVS